VIFNQVLLNYGHFNLVKILFNFDHMHRGTKNLCVIHCSRTAFSHFVARKCMSHFPPRKYNHTVDDSLRVKLDFIQLRGFGPVLVCKKVESGKSILRILTMIGEQSIFTKRHFRILLLA
jgi:hypothetical protein